VNVVLDAANLAGVGFCAPPEDGYTTTALFWRVTGNSVAKIVDTDNHQTDEPSLALAQRGPVLVSIFGGARDDKYFNDHHFWGSTSRDNGATWSAPAVIADDGAHSMTAPVTAAVHATLTFSAAATVGGGSDGVFKCGEPKLLKSPTGAAWTTCSPDTKGLPGVTHPGAASLGVAANDKLYLAFRTSGAAGALAPGIVLWRER
jgi:hypothetical protein